MKLSIVIDNLLDERVSMEEVSIVNIPVLIAGGGPVGMTLALELARYGVRTTLVEKNPETTRHPKMDITNGRSMELFRRLGVVDKLRSVGVPGDNPFDVSWITSLAGHELHRFRYESPNEFRRRMIDANDGTQPVEPPLRVSQVVIEPVLKAAIEANPLVDVRFGTRFERIVLRDESGVTSEVVTPSGEAVQIRAQYLAGCDGGGSKVRTEVGIELDGEFDFARAFMVHFRSDDRALLQRWGKTWHYQNAFGSLIAQNDKDIWTLQAWILPGMDESQMTPEGVLEDWVGSRFEYEVLQANPWRAHFVVAKKYMSGRVALAGDAAHQYVPTGGYGMNSGVGDAAGLGWVLAGLIQGWGGSHLLEAYSIERRAVALNCLSASKRHMGVRLAIGDVYMEHEDLEKDSPEVESLRAEAARKIEKLGNAENESWGVELGYRYDTSPVIFSEPDAPAVDPLVYKGSTWPGSRLPNVYLEDGTALHDHLGLYYTLIVECELAAAEFEAAAAKLGVNLKLLRPNSVAAKSILDHRLILVRPDQHIVWRGDSVPANCASILAVAMGLLTTQEAESDDSAGDPSAMATAAHPIFG